MTIIERIEAFEQRHPDERAVSSFGGVSDFIIQNAEKSIGFQFPESYKLFLRTYGQAYIGNYYLILGISNPERSDSLKDCVFVTNRLRKDISEDFPKHFIAFVSDNGEMYFCFDASQKIENHEYPIVRYFPFEGIEQGFPDFSAFIDYAIEFYES
jgi:antitoxin YobK